VRWSARSIAAPALLCSIVCVVLLHALRPELPPMAHRLSEYANGPFGWLMTMALVTLGCGIIALGSGSGYGSLASTSVSLLSVLAGAGMLVAAVFRTDVSPLSEIVHSRASALATVAIVLIAIVSVVPKRADPIIVTTSSFGRSVVVAGALLLPVSVLLHDSAWTGLGQRMLWAVLVSWLFLASRTPVPDTRPST
jgi:hypothetical protein